MSNTGMESREVVPRGTEVPDNVQARQGALYGVFVRMALEGCSLSAALKDANFPRRTYFDWERDYPEWMAEVRREALQFATDQIKAYEQQLAMRRLAVQRSIDEIILEDAEAIVTEQVRLSKEAKSELARLGAAKAVAKFATEGFLYHRGNQRPEAPDPEEGIPYNPHEVDISKANITLPPGSRVSIETPDIIDALPAGGHPPDDTRTHP